MKLLKTPYIAGGVVGLLLTFSAAVWGDYFAPVSVYPKIGSLLLHLTGNPTINKLKFFTVDHGSNSYHQIFGFQTFFIIGIFLGALITALIQGKFKFSSEVPELFKQRFGNRKKLRFILAFVGGLVLSIGAMMASGCNILYGISAFAKFDTGGIITFIAFYLGGIIVNWFIYRGVK